MQLWAAAQRLKRKGQERRYPAKPSFHRSFHMPARPDDLVSSPRTKELYLNNGYSIPMDLGIDKTIESATRRWGTKSSGPRRAFQPDEARSPILSSVRPGFEAFLHKPKEARLLSLSACCRGQLGLRPSQWRLRHVATVHFTSPVRHLQPSKCA